LCISSSPWWFVLAAAAMPGRSERTILQTGQGNSKPRQIAGFMPGKTAPPKLQNGKRRFGAGDAGFFAVVATALTALTGLRGRFISSRANRTLPSSTHPRIPGEQTAPLTRWQTLSRSCGQLQELMTSFLDLPMGFRPVPPRRRSARRGSFGQLYRAPCSRGIPAPD